MMMVVLKKWLWMNVECLGDNEMVSFEGWWMWFFGWGFDFSCGWVDRKGNCIRDYLLFGHVGSWKRGVRNDEEELKVES